ncbi:solute carrier family 2, facilitated glucose transporter member 3-like isoform X1 [Ciona intestinalis]
MNTKNSIFGCFCLFMTSWMLMSATLYNFGIINSLTPLLKIMYNSTYQNTYHVSMSSNTWTLLLSVTASSIYIGAVLGGFGTNYLLNVLSRRSTMQLTHIIHIIGVLVISVCGGFTWSFGAIFVGRLITGISLGMSYNLPTLVVAELSSRGSQGFWESLVGVSGLFGLFAAVVFGNPKVMGNMELWPYLVGLSIIPSIIYLISSVWIPNTPFYLVRQGKHEEAIETLSKLRISNQVNVTKEMEAMKEEIKQVKAVTIVEMVTTKSYRNQFIAVVMLYLNLVLVGIDGVVMYSNLMFKEAGLTTSQASIATISVFGAQLLAGVVGSTLVQKYGGRKMLIISNIVIITSLTVCTISRGVPHSKHSATVFVAVGAIGLFLIAWSAGTNPSIFALLAAITTEPTRPTAFGYAALMFWVSDCSVGVGFPFLQKYMGAYSLTPWLAFSVVFLFFSIFFIPETKNKSVKEIQAKFGRSGNEENKPLLNE